MAYLTFLALVIATVAMLRLEDRVRELEEKLRPQTAEERRAWVEKMVLPKPTPAPVLTPKPEPPPVDRTKQCLTDGRPVDAGHREIKENGQQRDYVVLTSQERAKGFVRPVRTVYRHIGRPVCGKYRTEDEYTDITRKNLGGEIYTCVMEPNHDGPCTVWKGLSQPEAADARCHNRLGGCGTTTNMSRAIAETYARDPGFYSGTFCITCKEHFPLNQFVWEGTTEQVGS